MYELSQDDFNKLHAAVVEVVDSARHDIVCVETDTLRRKFNMPFASSTNVFALLAEHINVILDSDRFIERFGLWNFCKWRDGKNYYMFIKVSNHVSSLGSAAQDNEIAIFKFAK